MGYLLCESEKREKTREEEQRVNNRRGDWGVVVVALFIHISQN